MHCIHRKYLKQSWYTNALSSGAKMNIYSFLFLKVDLLWQCLIYYHKKAVGVTLRLCVFQEFCTYVPKMNSSCSI